MNTRMALRLIESLLSLLTGLVTARAALADLEIHQHHHYHRSFFLVNAKSMPCFEFCIPVVQVVMVI